MRRFQWGSGRRIALLQLLLMLALVLAACGSSSHSAASRSTIRAPAAAPRSHGTVHAMMRALWFYPTVIHAAVGQKVVWTNDDSSPHNVTYVSGPRFKSSRRSMTHGAKFSLRLTQPGTIHYYCSLHPWMRATIVVST